jgi:hypothetical protein
VGQASAGDILRAANRQRALSEQLRQQRTSRAQRRGYQVPEEPPSEVQDLPTRAERAKIEAPSLRPPPEQPSSPSLLDEEFLRLLREMPTIRNDVIQGEPAPPEQAMPIEGALAPAPSGPDLTSYMEAIRALESGGLGYQAMGPEIVRGAQRGTRALGAYQLMPSTIQSLVKQGGFDQLRDLAGPALAEAVLASPKLQDKLMRELTLSNMVSMGIGDGEYLFLEDALAAAHYAGAGKGKEMIRAMAFEPGPTRTLYNEPVTTTERPFPSIRQYVDRFRRKRSGG